MDGNLASGSVDDLAARISATTGLQPATARRLIGDVLRYHHESVEAFVQRRHREMTSQGLKNAEIYEQLRREVAGRLFAGPRCSVRQIRRMIYG